MEIYQSLGVMLLAECLTYYPMKPRLSPGCCCWWWWWGGGGV